MGLRSHILVIAALWLVLFLPASVFATNSPSIIVPPQSQSVLTGSNAVFTVTAGGQTPLFYHWSFNSVDLTNSTHVSGATNSTLTVSNLIASNAGNYQVVVTNGHGSVTSSIAVLTVLFPPAITNQPIGQFIVLSNNVTFSSGASGTAPLSYQWYFNSTRLTNGGRVSGSTTASLTISNVQTNDAGNYQLTVTNSYGSINSTPAALSVLLPAVIASQPAGQSVLLTSNASFTASIAGTAPLSPQWYFNGAPLSDGGRTSGSTTTNLTISNVQTSDTGPYQLVVTNNYGSSTSQVAALTVLVPANITSQPTNEIVILSNTATFTISAVGTSPLNCRWYFNNLPLTDGNGITGSSTTNLSLANVQTNEAGSYQAIVANNYGSSTSQVVTLTVLMPATITSQPQSQSISLGSNVTFTSGASGTTPLTYQWYLNGVPLTDGGRISGSTTPSLAITDVQLTDAGGYTMTASNLVNVVTSQPATLTTIPVVHYVNINAQNPVAPYTSWGTASVDIQSALNVSTPGDLVWVTNGLYATGGLTAGGGALTNRVVDNGVNVQSVNGPSVTAIAGYPVVGSNAVRCVYLTNSATLSGFTLSSGATLNLNNENADEEGGGVWCDGTNDIVTNCVVANNQAYFSGGGAFSGTLEQCLITGNSAGGNPNYDPGGGVANSTLNFCTLTNNSGEDGGGAFQGVLNNCLVVNNSAVGGGGAYFATLNNCTVVGNGAWGGGGGVFGGTINNCIIYFNSTDNIQVVGYGSLIINNSCTTPLPVTGSGNTSSDPLFIGYTNGNYHLHLGSPCIDAGNNTNLDWNVDLDSNPRIVNNTVDMGAYEYQDLPINIFAQPTGQTNVMGQTAILAVGAESPYPLYYQWLFNSNGIPGATNSSLVLSNAQVSQKGFYSVTISNSIAISNSITVFLDVLYPPPTIVQQQTNQSVVITWNTVLSVIATNYLPMTYQWQFNGTNLMDAGEFSGSATANLNITGAQLADAGNYQVIISTTDGVTTSAVDALTVLVPASITSQPTNLTVLTSNTVSFAVTPAGTTPFSYTWYNNGLVLTNGGRVSGATSNVLTISSVQTNDSGPYQVLVTNICGMATSTVASLTVLAPAQISGQPASQDVLLGNSVIFTVTASGSALGYQWFYNGTPLSDAGRISGSATPTLMITGVQSGDAGGYVVEVSNILSAAFSHAASLTPLVTLGASIRYVNISNAAPQSPYLTWGTAATNIQDAVDAAVSGDQVVVTDGVYQAGGWVMYGALTNRVMVNKPITVQSVNGPGATTIQGVHTLGNNAIRCVYLTNGASLIGFKLTNGATRFLGDVMREQSGAGIWCEDGSSIISNCIVAGCQSEARGGGVLQGTVINCMLTNNSAGMAGGGAYSNLLYNCTLIHNSVGILVPYSGGGACFCTLSNCLVVANTCGERGNGGGAYSSTVYSCVFSNNANFLGYGGGLCLGYATNTLISSNSAAYGGGANSNVLVNCILRNNLANYVGGGAFGGVLTNCTLTNNTASSGGGAATNLLVNCTLIRNTANNIYNGYSSGGGAYFSVLNNCLLVGNVSPTMQFPGYGGGAAYSTLNNCVLSNNAAGSGGGGTFEGYATGCLISSNRTAVYGGGANSNVCVNCTLTNNYGEWGGAAAYGSFTQCVIIGNRAQNDGGALYIATADDCLITFNSAGLAGVATYNGVLRDCTVVSNITPPTAGLPAVYGSAVTNCIVYDNFGGNIVNSKLIAYTCTTPVTAIPGNITNAPLFVNEAGGDYHLQSTSPCINSGYNPGVVVGTDFDGNPRIVGGTVDMGAYEYQSPGSIISYAWLEQYGLPLDGSVDFSDLDGIGLNNAQKSIAGLNPTNPASTLVMQSSPVTNTTAGITVTWQSVNTRAYFLQRSLNVTMPFSTIRSNILGQAGPTTSYLDVSATNGVPYFYRVGVQQ